MNSSVNELLSLNGSCAVIIGGKGIIGYPITEAIAEAGAIVFVASPTSNNNDKMFHKLRDKGLEVYGKQLDQSNEKQVISLIKDIEDEVNVSPNILVNSGVYRPMKKYLSDDTKKWDRSMEINSRGLFITCKQFADKMKENGGGSIINIASIYGIVAPKKNIYDNTNIDTEPDYPYNKGGMIMFSKYMASYFAEYNVRVNCIAPGGIFNNQDKSFVKRYIDRVPMGRMGTQNDLKGISVFLSSKASTYITGCVIPVDGGLTII